MKAKIAVVAHKQAHFEDFLMSWVNPEDMQNFHLVTREKDIIGMIFSHVISITPMVTEDDRRLRDLCMSRVVNGEQFTFDEANNRLVGEELWTNE